MRSSMAETRLAIFCRVFPGSKQVITIRVRALNARGANRWMDSASRQFPRRSSTQAVLKPQPGQGMPKAALKGHAQPGRCAAVRPTWAAAATARMTPSERFCNRDPRSGR